MAELTSKEPSPDCIFGKASPKSCKSESPDGSAGTSPLNLSCPNCGSKKLWRDGSRYTIFDDKIQRWLCKECGLRFSDKDDLKKAKQAIEPVETVERQSLKTPNAIVSSSQICVTETKNLETEPQTTEVPRKSTEESRGKIVEHGFWMQKEGHAESIVTRRMRMLKTLVNKGRQSTRSRISQRNNRQTKQMGNQDQGDRRRNIRLLRKILWNNLEKTDVQIGQKTSVYSN